MNRYEHEKGLLEYYKNNGQPVPDKEKIDSVWRKIRREDKHAGALDRVSAQTYFNALQVQRDVDTGKNIEVDMEGMETSCKKILKEALQYEKDHPMSGDELKKFREDVAQNVAEIMTVPALLHANKYKRDGAPNN